MIEMNTTTATAQIERLSKARDQTVDFGNNEQVTRGLVQVADGFFALTFTNSKQFTTRAAAVRWLAKRGVFVS